MCKLIAELAGADKQILREMINRLEHASGAPGVDIRLSGEIYSKIHMKTRELGLDSRDTTPQELYQSLLNLTMLHDKFLAQRIGIKDHHDASNVLPAAVRYINRVHIPKQTWALKHAAAKRLLKATPPKTLMKLLHYRSIDSLLKRESAAMVVTAARYIEPAAWQQRFVNAYKHVKANDFEIRDIELEYMDHERWQPVSQVYASQKRTAILHSVEMGAIAVLPLPAQPFDGLTLASLLLIIHYINDIRSYSTYFKFHHMRADFGTLLSQTILSGGSDHARLAGQPIHWKIIHRYYGSQARLNHPEIFEPHVQAEDLSYRKAEEFLYRLEPALHFWHNLDYVGAPQSDGPVSFNLTDMAMNVLNHVAYQNRFNYHLRESVWNELYTRYLGQRNLERQLLQDLDDQPAAQPGMIADMDAAWL